jgi:hypothetical protein
MTTPIPSTSSAVPPSPASPTMVRRSGFRATVLEELGGEPACDQKPADPASAPAAPDDDTPIPQMKSHPSKPCPPDEKGNPKKQTSGAEPAQPIPNVVIENVAAIVFPVDSSASSATADVASENTREGPSSQKSAPVALASGADISWAQGASRTATPELSLPQGKRWSRDLVGLEALNSNTTGETRGTELGEPAVEPRKSVAVAESQSAASSAAVLPQSELKQDVPVVSKRLTPSVSTAKNISPGPYSALDTRVNEVPEGKKNLGADAKKASNSNEILASVASSNDNAGETQSLPATPQPGIPTDSSPAVSISNVVFTPDRGLGTTPIINSQQPGRDTRVSADSESSNRPPTPTRHSEDAKETAPSPVPIPVAQHRPPEMKAESFTSHLQTPSSSSGTALVEAAHSSAEGRPGPTNTDSTLSRDSGIPHGIPEPTNPPLMSGMVREAHFVANPKQTEMHIDLRTTTFGSIEVHAVIRDSQVGLSIGSERGDLRHLLSTEVPAMESRLQRHDLQLDSVRFIDQGHAFNAGTSSGNPAKEWPAASARNSHIVDVGEEPSSMDAADPDLVLINRPGLNIRA